MNKPSFISRIVGGALATGALLVAVWTVVLLVADYRYRRLPPLADEQNDPVFLGRMGGELERILKLDPNHGEARNAYASVLGRERRNEEAAAQLERALVIQNSQNSLFFLADMQERLGKHDSAEATMADSVVINPFNPRLNQAYIRLLFRRLGALQTGFEKGKMKDRQSLEEARRRYAEAARAWFVRAPNDANAYLFMANYHVSQIKTTRPQFYLIQAYRLLLIGVSRAPWLDLTDSLMIPAAGAHGTINDILRNRFAKPYKGLK